MPRHPTEHDGNVPLWLIPAVLLEWIKKVGEDLEWVRIRRSARHYYQISVRIRAVKREFSRRAAAIARCGPGAEAEPEPDDRLTPVQNNRPEKNVQREQGAQPAPDPKKENAAEPAPGPEGGRS